MIWLEGSQIGTSQTMWSMSTCTINGESNTSDIDDQHLLSIESSTRYHGVISKVLLRTDRNLSTGDAFRIDHTPHRVGVDLGIPLDIANRRDSPAWYLYRVTLSNPNIFPDLDLVSSDRLSRDLGFLAIAIMTKLPRPRRRYPAGRRVPPRLSVGSQAITPMPGVPIAQVNFAFGNPSNINAGGGTFVSGNGPGTTQNNSGGTFNDVSRDLLWETPGYQA
ncbi:hypothetical protein HGRIS_000065 [Hohenbuehelia grisea]|uniref:Uncharacterized protein n=1 Tax=Hohenbuehelia grisea TaxID=104357 RepID=A0ABR3JQ43_9AGAR